MGMFGASLECGRSSIERLEAYEINDILYRMFQFGRLTSEAAEIPSEVRLKYMQNVFRAACKNETLLEDMAHKRACATLIDIYKKQSARLYPTQMETFCKNFISELRLEGEEIPGIMKLLCTPSQIDAAAKAGSSAAKQILHEKEVAAEVARRLALPDKTVMTRINNTVGLDPHRIYTQADILTNKDIQKIKEKAHFDKLYEGVKKESAEAQKALKEKLAEYKKSEKYHFKKIHENTAKESEIAQKTLRRRLSAKKEKAHFDKLFENVKQESETAQKALRRRLSAKKEKAHFDKLYENVKKEREIAQKALKERFAQFKANKSALNAIKSKAENAPKLLPYNPAAAGIDIYKAAQEQQAQFIQQAIKNKQAREAATHEIKPFKDTVSDAINSEGKGLWAAIKRNKKIAAGLAATIAVIGGAAYIMNGNKNNNINQQQVTETRISNDTVIKWNV